jgi:type VI secretion system protein ImpH
LPAIGDHAVLGRAGLCGMQTRPPEALEKIITGYFSVPARVEGFTGEWLDIPVDARTTLGSAGEPAQLGMGAILGGKSWQVQHGATLHVGPLDYAQFCDFLPGAPGRAALEEFLGMFAGGEWHWRLRMVLNQPKIPPLCLGKTQGVGRPVELGWSTWLGEPGAAATREVLIDLGASCLVAGAPASSARDFSPSRQEVHPV